MFFGMLMVDAALAAWAVGLLGQPWAPRWVRLVLLWLGASLVASVGLVAAISDRQDNQLARAVGLIAPLGAVSSAAALLLATWFARRRRPPPVR